MSSRDDTAPDFHALFEASPGGYLVLNPDAPRFTIVAVTDAYLQTTLTQRDEILGRGLFEVFPDNPDDPDTSGTTNLRHLLERVIATRAPDTLPVQKYDIRRQDGRFEERYWSQMSSPVCGADGALRWLLLWEEDVTDFVREKKQGQAQRQVAEALRKRAGEMEAELARAQELKAANAQLEEANARLRQMQAENEAARKRAQAAEQRATGILESITDAFMALDTEWRFTYVNQRAEELFGRTRAQLIGRELWSEIPKDSPIGRALREAMADQRTSVMEAPSWVLGRQLEVHANPSPDTLSVFMHDVTARHDAQEALRESERRFRSIFNESMDAVHLARPDGSITFANRASTRLFGYSESELQVLGRDAVFVPDDPRVERFFSERRRAGRARSELTMKRKDGTRIPVEVSSAIFMDEQGAEWTSVFIRDISERKAQEAEREELVTRLEAERRWLRAVLDTSPVGLLLFQADGQIYMNESIEKLFGLVLSEEGGSAQYEQNLFFPDGTPVPFDELLSTRALQRGETVVNEPFLLEWPPGTRIPLVCSAAPIRDPDGEIQGAVLTLQDVSDSQRTQRKIRLNERLLSSLFEILPVGLAISDENGRIVRSNLALQRIWEGAAHDAGLSEFDDYTAWWADTGERVTEEDWALSRALTKGETSVDELLRIQCFDGTFKTILNSALPLEDEDGHLAGAVLMNQDVTQLKEVEEALREAIRVREEILGIVAHDLRNPLGSILLQVEAMARRSDDEKRRTASLDAIRRQVRRMRQLIQDLLDVSQMESGTLSQHLGAVPTKTLLAEVTEEHEPLVSAASLRLQLDIPDALADVRADRHRLLQVFENLVGNALKFTKEGGRITVGATPRGTEMLFWVSDTGVGISADSVSRLFDPFWQADPHDRRGVGLGLPIVKGIVEASGGRIWAESRLGVGTTFYFTLPIDSGHEADRGVEPLRSTT